MHVRMQYANENLKLKKWEVVGFMLVCSYKTAFHIFTEDDYRKNGTIYQLKEHVTVGRLLTDSEMLDGFDYGMFFLFFQSDIQF